MDHLRTAGESTYPEPLQCLHVCRKAPPGVERAIGPHPGRGTQPSPLQAVHLVDDDGALDFFLNKPKSLLIVLTSSSDP